MNATLDLTKPIQWKRGDAHRIGRAAMVQNGSLAYKVPFYHDDCLLVRHSHTGELELVPLEELSQYPSSPIEEP